MVSIIIPVYNHARTLRRCLRSIEKQTYKNIEVIVVNDGSTDNFHKVFKNINLKSRIKNLKLINQFNMGAPAARNRGFKQSSGDYVIFWDADVVARPDKIARLKQALDEHPGAAYAYNQFRWGWKKFKSFPFDAERLKKMNYIHTSALIRRVAFSGFDENLKRFQDWDLWLTMLAKNQTGVFVPAVLHRVIVGWRRGISRWLPKFIYEKNWKIKRLKDYQNAQAVIYKKHHLI